MSDRKGVAERRRHVRIAPKGSVQLLAGEHLQRGRIANICQGGLLATTSVSAPDRLLGRIAELELRLDDQNARWLSVAARIVRIGAETVAFAFEPAPPMLVRLIDDAIAASRANDRILSVLLVDSDLDRRSSIATGFRTVGCTVLEIATPLEAVVRLGESRFEFDLIAIADSSPSEVSQDLRQFVTNDHSRVKLVTINNDLAEPLGALHWLSGSDPDSDLLARVRDVIHRQRRP